MPQTLLYQEFDFFQRNKRDSLLLDPQIQKLFRQIDADHRLIGAGVIYVDSDFRAIRLREFSAFCRLKPIHIVLHEIPPKARNDEYVIKLKKNPRESRLMAEAIGSGLSCGAAVLGWMVIVGSIGATPVTGGVSAAVTILTYGAASASLAQCGIGLGRAVLEVTTPDLLDTLDSQEWYQTVSVALDVISLSGAASSALTAFKAYRLVRTSSSQSLFKILKRMSRAERKRMTQEIIRINHPGVSNARLKRMISSGLYPQRYPAHSINTALMLHVKDAVGATLSFSGSALSGTIKNMVIGIYEEVK